MAGDFEIDMEKPHITDEGLSRYLVESPLVRAAIAERHKYLRASGAVFDPVRAAVVEALVGNIAPRDLVKRCGIQTLRVLGQLPLGGLQPGRRSRAARTIFVNGVTVYVCPDVLLRDTEGNLAGAVKVLTHRSSAPCAHYAAVLLSEAYGDHCAVVDIRRSKYILHRESRRNTLDIRSACDEIRRAWPTL